MQLMPQKSVFLLGTYGVKGKTIRVGRTQIKPTIEERERDTQRERVFFNSVANYGDMFLTVGTRKH